MGGGSRSDGNAGEAGWRLAPMRRLIAAANVVTAAVCRFVADAAIARGDTIVRIILIAWVRSWVRSRVCGGRISRGRSGLRGRVLGRRRRRVSGGLRGRVGSGLRCRRGSGLRGRVGGGDWSGVCGRTSSGIGSWLRRRVSGGLRSGRGSWCWSREGSGVVGRV